MSNHFNLSATRMLRAMDIPGANAARHYLEGVYVEPLDAGGVAIVATDGHVMLVQWDREGVAPAPALLRLFEPALPFHMQEPEHDDEPWVTRFHWCAARIRIPADVADAPVAAPCFHQSDDRPFAHIVAETLHPADIYPDWRIVVAGRNTPSKAKLHHDPERMTGIRPDLLDRITAGHDAVRISQNSPNYPITVTFSDDPDSLGIISPARMPKDEAQHQTDLLATLAIEDDREARP